MWRVNVSAGLLACFLSPVIFPISSPISFADSLPLAGESSVEVTAPPAAQFGDPSVWTTVIDLAPFRGTGLALEELLRREAGVQVKALGGMGQFATIALRGSNAGQVAVFLDGVRLNPGSGGGVDLSGIALDQLDRIEIVRGGASALAGDGALAGAVYLISRKGASTPSGSASVSYGSFGTFQAGVAHSQPLGPVGVFASLVRRQTEGDYRFRDTRGTFTTADDQWKRRENNDFASWDGLLRLSARPAPLVRVEAGTQWFEDFKGSPGLTYVLTPGAELTHRRHLEHLTFDAGLDPKGIHSFEGEAFFTGTSIIYDERAPEGQPSAQSRQKDTAWGGKAGYGWRNHGQEASVLVQGERRTLNGEGFSSPRRTTWEAAGSGSFHPFGKALAVFPAIRYSRMTDTGRAWSPKVGVRWDLTGSLAFKANGSQSFRAPDFTELYANEGYIIGNPALEPERSWSGDAGFSWEGGPFQAEVVGYYSWYRDLIQWELTGGRVYKPFNLGRALIQGAEVSARWRPAGWLEIRGAYGWLDAESRSGGPNEYGKKLVGRPRHTGSAGLRFHWRQLHPEVGMESVDGAFATRSNTKWVPGRTQWHVQVSWEATPFLTAGVEVRNLFDTEAFDVRGYPLPGRSLSVSLRGKW